MTNYNCDECSNSFDIENGKLVGDIVECPFCGTEFEVMEISDEGAPSKMEMVEEYK